MNGLNFIKHHIINSFWDPNLNCWQNMNKHRRSRIEHCFFSTLRVVEHIHWLDVGKVLTLNLCFFLKKFKKVRTFFKLGVHVEQPPKKIAEILGHFPHHSADGYGMHGNELPSHAAWRQRWRSDSHRGVVLPDCLRWISWRVFLPSVFLGFFEVGCNLQNGRQNKVVVKKT